MSGSLTPRSFLTPDETSTASAPVFLIASATLLAVSPPARIHGTGARQSRSSDQSNRVALPPGRVAPVGAFASSTSRSAPSEASVRSSLEATPTERQTGKPNRAPKSRNVHAAVDLQHVELHKLQRRGNHLSCRINEQPDPRRLRTCTGRQHGSLLRCHVARRWRKEIKAQPVGTRRNSRIERHRMIDAADLDPNSHGGDVSGSRALSSCT